MSEAPSPADVFSQRLQSARDARDLSQQDLARKTGLPASSISHFEGGGRKPSFDNLHKLADALNVTTDYLLGRSEETAAVSAASRLHRHLEKLSGRDLEMAERFIEVLATSKAGDERSV